MDIKLFHFYPQGHGVNSYFVIAKSEKDAREAVELSFASEPESEHRGWGTDYYEMQVFEVGQVAKNPND